MKTHEIKEKIDEGYIQANVMFEVVGKPKAHIEGAITRYMKKLREEEDVIILNEDIDVAEELEGEKDMWTIIAEVELLAKGLEKLTWISYNFMPASIEIMSPDKLTFKAQNLTNWLNDGLAKNHEVAIVSQRIGQQNKLMVQNINVLLRNSILICIDNKMTLVKDFEKKIGIIEKDLQPVLDAMLKEKTIKKEGDNYVRQ